MKEEIPWSWSRLDTFEACPKQFYHKNIIKSVPFKQNAAMVRGERLHKHLELAMRGEPIHEEIAHMTDFLEGLRRLAKTADETLIEVEHAYTRDMKSVRWFSKKAWLRIKQDYAMKHGTTAVSLDWKSGKNRGYSDQLKLYAAEIMFLWPDVERVVTSYIFVDSDKKKESAEFTRDDYEHIWQDFEDRAERIQIANENDDWPAKPSHMGCRFCPVIECKARK